MISKPIFPCLWYDGKAREAADFYCQIFPNSKVLSDNGMVVKFELNGREFMGLNGGPNFKFDEAVSFCIECETQEELDYYLGKSTKKWWKRKSLRLAYRPIRNVLSSLS